MATNKEKGKHLRTDEGTTYEVVLGPTKFDILVAFANHYRDPILDRPAAWISLKTTDGQLFRADVSSCAYAEETSETGIAMTVCGKLAKDPDNPQAAWFEYKLDYFCDARAGYLTICE